MTWRYTASGETLACSGAKGGHLSVGQKPDLSLSERAQNRVGPVRTVLMLTCLLAIGLVPLFTTSCSGTSASPANHPIQVEVAPVQQRDVPLYKSGSALSTASSMPT